LTAAAALTQIGVVRILVTLAAAVLFTACGGSGDGGGSPAADAASPGPDGGSGGPDGGAPLVVTYQDVKPIFMQKCTPCHSAGGIGAALHTLADSYESANKPSSGSCPGKTVGQCTLVMVKMGFMPYERGCTGDPAKDSANAACLTAAEQQKLADWIAGGLKEK
jgi:hypothetical protein